MKVGRNQKCPCGSGNKYKNCCMNKDVANIKQPGTLRRTYVSDVDNDDFPARLIMQMCQIRDFLYTENERLSYDRSYSPVYQNLLEAKIAVDRYKKLVSKHDDDIVKKLDGIYHGNQIDVVNPIDDDLNIFFKDLFIRGRMTMDCLFRHCEYMGFNIQLLFSDDTKKYRNGIDKFPLAENDPKLQYLLKLIKSNKDSWYREFLEIRRKIEHDGYCIDRVNYQLDQSQNVIAIYPKYKNQDIIELLNICLENLISFCEVLIINLFALKLDSRFEIIQIPETLRDKSLPIKYKVLPKNFSGFKAAD